ncbi:MAG: YbjQ family protein [Candidatus Omnitrophica bacterium]|nr:YbjQ family protein [Candidatus Omnitrophota bacterium]
MDLIIFLVFVGGAYLIGQHIEKSHYKEIEKKESACLHIPSVTSKKIVNLDEVLDAKLVFGNVVISGDYFKMIVASLLNFFGGRVTPYEKLLDRARREAILRMKQDASSMDADMIINTRFEMSKLDSMARGGGGTGMFEIIAYGTAVKLAKK